MEGCETHVSLETAELLNKVGFGWNCRGLYIGTAFLDAYFNDVVNGTDYKKIQAPTLDIAQKWLREVKKVIIEVMYSNTDHNWYNRYCDQGIWGDGHWHNFENKEPFKTYEDALEDGINNCLNILIGIKKRLEENKNE